MANDPLSLTRRQFLSRSSAGLGSVALASLLSPAALGAPASPAQTRGLAGLPHHAAKAKRVVYLFQSGAPSQLDMWDHKPAMAAMFDKELPDSVRAGQRLTGMTSGQTRLPIAPSIFKFQQHGNSGAWVSELMPHMAQRADDVCFVKSMFTEAINHDPAITFFQTGAQLAGRPSMGSWVTYGLGSENSDLPSFVGRVGKS